MGAWKHEAAEEFLGSKEQGNSTRTAPVRFGALASRWRASGLPRYLTFFEGVSDSGLQDSTRECFSASNNTQCWHILLH